jgi:tRNA A37 threonylcarbamoyladenosine synthetase subunit TsaC/SUA5/YrdC
VAEYLQLHPINPQARLIRRAAELLRAGGLIAYPTDSCYALGWHLGDAQALERVRRIRQADRHHHFTLVCANLAEVGRSIGVRIPAHPVPQLLLAELKEPLMSSTLLVGGDAQPLTSGAEIAARLTHEIDAILDGGDCGIEPTTVVDLSVTPPVIVRKGKGDLGPIMGRAL